MPYRPVPGAKVALWIIGTAVENPPSPGTALNQLAGISIPEPHQIVIQPWDRGVLGAIEKAIDAVLQDIAQNGVTEAELERAKKAYLAEYIYESDSQSTLARRYGWGLVVGRTVADIDAWPERISAVKLEDVKAVARRYFDIRRSVTGTLLPVAPDGFAQTGAKAHPGRS